jgi:uncharacterized hydrophobic protein (TIGR00271 family)
MLQLRVYAAEDAVADLAESVRGLAGARHVVVAHSGDGDRAVLEADLHNDAADPAVAIARDRGVPVEDIALLRLDDIGPASVLAEPSAVVWTDLVAQAGINARPAARYLALMGCAGVIAGFAVIDHNQVLVVGAMAISPDMLPLTAACIGLVARRPSFVGRGLLALAAGLAFAGLVAGILTAGLDLFGSLPTDFSTHVSGVPGEGIVSSETILVALAAGIAGMLALETRASAAVGVAISVTTIPAAAYLGVAAGVGNLSQSGAAVAVLLTNVLLILVGGTTTLWLQRMARRRRAAQRG